MVITMTTILHDLLKSPKIGPPIHTLTLRFIIEWGYYISSFPIGKIIQDYGLQKI